MFVQFTSCFLVVCRSLKTYAIEKTSSNNNMLKVNNKRTTNTRYELSPSLTIKAI